MTCANCKHWGAASPDERYEYYNSEAADDEDEFVTLPSHKVCGLIRLSKYSSSSPPPPAFVQDASGYRASLWTAPGFSCSLFEAP